jgi:hypothetical protein
MDWRGIWANPWIGWAFGLPKHNPDYGQSNNQGQVWSGQTSTQPMGWRSSAVSDQPYPGLGKPSLSIGAHIVWDFMAERNETLTVMRQCTVYMTIAWGTKTCKVGTDELVLPTTSMYHIKRRITLNWANPHPPLPASFYHMKRVKQY